MTRSKFVLLGYDNPLGRFPAPVVPVGLLGDELVAVYAGDESPSHITLEGGAQYFKFDVKKLNSFVDFDPRLHQLFAISTSDIRRYLIKGERKFFSKLLKQESFSYNNPFLRLSLAKATSDYRLIVWELASSILWMPESTPELVDSWYGGQLSSLRDSLPYLAWISIPGNWRHLPAIPKSLNGWQMETFSEFARRNSLGARLSSFTQFITLVIWSIIFTYVYAIPEILRGSVDWVFILAGIVLTHVFILYSLFYRESSGYLLRAAGKIWLFLFRFFIIQLAIGSFCFYLALTFLGSSGPSWLLAFIIGVAVAAVPTILELALLPKGSTTVTTLRLRLITLLAKLYLLLLPYFAWTIEYCREEDVFDDQQPNAWGIIPGRILDPNPRRPRR